MNLYQPQSKIHTYTHKKIVPMTKQTLTNVQQG